MARVRLLLMAVSVLSIAFAGCTNGGAKDMPAASSSAAPPTVDDTTGSIHGFILDDQVMPVQDAEVAVVSLGLSTRSDGNGEFTLNGVQPGEHSLFASKLGFEASARRVSVAIGEVTEIQIALAPIAIAEPFMVSVPFSGQFECSVAAVDVYWLDCSNENVFPESESYFYFEKPEGVTYVLGELKWTSASAGTGQNLDFNLVKGSSPADTDSTQWYANRFGASPLQLLVTVGEQFENPDSPAAVGSSSQDQVVDDEDTKLGFNIYSSPTYVQDQATVGITFQQRYEGMVTLFYNMDVPEGFSAFPDA